jgi:SAM-dependent methyltransferase
MKKTNPIQSIVKTYNKISLWGKILIFVLLLLMVIQIFKNVDKTKQKEFRESFQQRDNFLVKTGTDVYDDFYSGIYDYLVYSNVKNAYEVGEILNTTKPTSVSKILDIGSGTGHHVAELSAQGFDVMGVDISEAMVKKARSSYPKNRYITGDIIQQGLFEDATFTHILCMYFTLYYMKDKTTFFKNCYNWLMPGGYLIVHVVDRNMFDPILPPGNPFVLVSPQKYAKQRITSTKVVFDDFHYSSQFDLDESANIATFEEKFKSKADRKTRKNQHTLYMEPENDIITMAQNQGFIIRGKIDLLKCRYEYQYLYILMKPT